MASGEGENGLETRLLFVISRMGRMNWGRSANDMPTILDSAEPHSGLSLLHVAAALNFHRLISTLISWRFVWRYLARGNFFKFSSPPRVEKFDTVAVEAMILSTGSVLELR